MKTNKQKGYVIPLVTAIVVILVVGVVYYSTQRKQSYCWPYCPNMTDQDREIIKNQMREATSTNPDTASWKTYTNPVFGYSFKYPSESELADQKSFDNNGNLIVVIFPQPSQGVGVQFSVSVSDNTANCYKNDLRGTSTRTVTINGNTYHVGSGGDQGMGGAIGEYTNYAIIKNSACYQLVMDLQWNRSSGRNFDEQKIQDYLKQILSTFKFISQ
ncbi:MAG: hypothetical protein WCS89_00090 [Candidatus Paceibacterota bacterium]